MKRKHWISSVVFAGLFALIAIAGVALADTTYVVRSGDTLAQIAANNGSSIGEIADANNIVNPNWIYVGQVLTIPDGSGGGNQPEPAPTQVAEQLYYVQYGDTLSRIAARFGVPFATLASYNNIANPNWIYVGQPIKIPGSEAAPQPQPTSAPAQPTPVPVPEQPVGEQSYVVASGDTMVRIAARFGTTSAAIAQRNNIANINYIYVGQVLIIPGSGSNPQPQPTIVPTQPPVQPEATPWPTAVPATPWPTAVPATPWPTAVPPTAVAPTPWPTAVPPTAVPPTALPPTLTPVPTQPPTTNAVFELGGQTHSLANPGVMTDVGMTWVKFQHKWGNGNRPQDLQGRISDAHSKGLKVLMAIPGSDHSNIDFGAYVEYLRGVAALGDPPDAIEVWNEMNIDREWPNGQISAELYTNQMLKPAYAAIKSSNPNVMVISGAPAPTGYFGGGCRAEGCDDKPYLEGMAAAGAASAMDCIGIHYNEGILPPSATSGDPRGNPNHYTRYYGSMVNTYLAAFNYEKPLCFTEIAHLCGYDCGGVPGGFSWAAGTSVDEHAQWLSETVAKAKADQNIRMLIIFNVDFDYYDPNGDPQAGFGMIRKNGSCPSCNLIKSVMGR